jgi:hypothetical protein
MSAGEAPGERQGEPDAQKRGTTKRADAPKRDIVHGPESPSKPRSLLVRFEIERRIQR